MHIVQVHYQLLSYTEWLSAMHHVLYYQFLRNEPVPHAVQCTSAAASAENSIGKQAILLLLLFLQRKPIFYNKTVLYTRDVHITLLRLITQDKKLAGNERLGTNLSMYEDDRAEQPPCSSLPVHVEHAQYLTTK